MTIKVYAGSAWQTQKSLKIYDGASWFTAKKGWAYNGTSWLQFYPEFPANTASPSVSGSSIQGNQLSVTTGTWTSTDAYIPTSYTYQWTRNGANISGATSSTYTTVVGDVGTSVACVVTAVNQRGSTPATSSNSITITSALPGPPTGLILNDGTATPGAPTVSTSSSATTTASVSWTAATGTFQSYSVSASPYAITNQNNTSRTATITGGTSGVSYTVYVSAVNSSGVITMSWTAPTGTPATSYDIYVDSSYVGNTTSTSYTYTVGSIGTKSVNVRSRNASGAETTGATQSVVLNNKFGTGQASSTFYAVYPSFTVLPSASSVTSTSAIINWQSSNQSSYSITSAGPNSPYNATTSATSNSVPISGLSGSTSYNVAVTITSSTGQTVTQYAAFTTPATPIIPVIGSFTVTNSNTLTYLNWTITGGNQARADMTASPATGGAGGGSTFFTTNSADRQKYVGTATAGQQYNFGITVTSTTGHTASASTTYTYNTGTAPGPMATPSINYVSGNGWWGGYTSPSSGTTPITVSWQLWTADDSSGTNAKSLSGASGAISTSLLSQGYTWAVSSSPIYNSSNYKLDGTTLQNWGQIRVTASNGVSPNSTTQSGWA